MIISIHTILCILASFGFQVIYGHSYVVCTDYRDGDCHAFARYTDFNTPAGSPTGYRDRNLQGTKCPIFQGEKYTTKFPMAETLPGQTLKLQWPPRGHDKQDSSQVSIKMSPGAVETTDKLLDSPDLTTFKELAKVPFQIGETSDKKCFISPTAGDHGTGNCTAPIIIPMDTKPGIYTFSWTWTLVGVDYTDCFDIKVTAASDQNGNYTAQSVNSPSNANGITNSQSPTPKLTSKCRNTNKNSQV